MAMSQALCLNLPNNIARTHCLLITLHPLPVPPGGDGTPPFGVTEIATYPTLALRMRLSVEGGERSRFDSVTRKMMEIEGDYVGALGVLSFERPGLDNPIMALIPGIFHKRSRWPVIDNWMDIFT